MDTLFILKNSKICLGPMSKNIVDVVIEIANEFKTPITLIPSRRQVEFDGGYVNNWTTQQFADYVRNRSEFVKIQRDHAGPGQGKTDDDGYESLKNDCMYLDSIHIDPWKKYQDYESAVLQTIDLIKYCHTINPEMYYEIGTEEAIRKIDCDELDKFISDVKESLPHEIFQRIVYIVIQSGTRLCENSNTGVYDNEKLCTMIKIANKHGLLTKEHNGDYMNETDMRDRYENGLDSINIAPELGYIESCVMIDAINTQRPELLDNLYKLCYDSGKWKKWVSADFDPVVNKIKIIEISGHYVFATEEFRKIKDELIDVDCQIKKELKEKVLRWLGLN